MPRKITKNKQEYKNTDKDITVEDINKGSSAPTSFSAFIKDERTRIVAGLLLVFLSVFLIVAYCSFFTTGSADYSVLTGGEAGLHRKEITNLLGLPGAYLSRFIVDGSFGIVSIVALILLLLYGLRLIGVKLTTGIRHFFITSFVLIWGAVLFGFIDIFFSINTFFRLGGAFGTTAAAWLESYIHPLGLTLLLFVLLVIFLIIIDRHFIARLATLKERISAAFSRKPDDDNNNNEPDKDEPDENYDNIVITGNNDDEQIQEINIDITGINDNTGTDDTEDIHLTIEDIKTEDINLDGNKNDQENTDDNNDTPSENNLEIEDVEEVELTENDPEYLLKKLGPYDPRKDLETYQFPSLQLLKVYDNETAPVIDPEEQQQNANRIVTTLRNYGIEIEQIKATVGPTVTLYEVVPKAGTRINRIQVLENDIMLSLSAIGIRIIAPMPGKGTVGIEVPNEKPQVVSMHSVIASKRFSEENKMRLPVAIGRTITNEVFCFDLAKTPHLLVAGATGQGKSVGLNAIITSLLYKKHPAELKFVLVDPKMVEFSIYKPLLKHYMAAMPDQEDRDIIITDCQKVINTLNSLVIEMEDRYSLLADANCRNVEDYNEKFNSRVLNPEKPVENVVTKKILHHRYMPYLVIIIDEYGDFIMQAGKEVERPIQRLAQKARAVGMHMILATQRPDVKIVTGTIKANIPTRIAFRTQSVVDSRTVLDAKGADQLIGKGDMLYAGGGNLTRIQCAFVDTPEVEAIVEHIQSQQGYTQPYQLPEYVPEGSEEGVAPGSVDTKRLDPMFADVARYVVSKQEGSTSRLQRVFEIGYNRAGKLSDQLEATGIVGPNKGPKGRDVLIQDMESLEHLLESLNC